MTFLELYGVELDRRLGSDQTDLFTTVKRKAAINAAQQWWIAETKCLWKTALIRLRTNIQEYDLEVEVDDESMIGLAAQAPDVQIVPATGATRYLAGPDDFPLETIDALDRDDPGWRTASAGEPDGWYTRQEGAQTMCGLTVAPSIPAGDVWTLRVPYVVQADTMTADTDEPFTLDSSVKFSLRPWHPVLADYATYQLEQLRKDLARSSTFLAIAQAGARDYAASVAPAPGEQVMQSMRDYRRRRRDREPWGARFGRTW